MAMRGSPLDHELLSERNKAPDLFDQIKEKIKECKKPRMQKR